MKITIELEGDEAKELIEFLRQQQARKEAAIPAQAPVPYWPPVYVPVLPNPYPFPGYEIIC